MAQLPSDFDPFDPGRVNVADPGEVEYWCMTLDCSVEMLQDVVARVGGHITQVRDQLARLRPDGT